MDILTMLRVINLWIWVVWILVYWWGGIAIVITFIEAVEARSTRLDVALLLIILGLGQILVWTGIPVSQGIVPVMSWANNVGVAGVGVVLTLIGAAGSTYCRYKMRQLWSAATKLGVKHRVMDTGLWGVVRHPLYGFVFVMYFGTVLVFSVWWEWIVLALMISAHVKKLMDEERFLVETLPGYEEYLRRVQYRIIPGVW